MEIQENTDSHELLQMTDSERTELMEMRRQVNSDKFSEFVKAVTRKVDSYKLEATNDVKMIMAMNELFGREFNQHDSFRLTGYEGLVSVITNKQLLANNNYVLGSNEIATETSVYLALEPDNVSVEEDKATLSNIEKIRVATEIYEAEGADYKLYLYLNTDKYDLYQALEEDLTVAVGREFEIISTFPNMSMRSKADLTVSEFPNASMNDILNSFLTAFNLFRDRRKSIYFDLDRRTISTYFNQLDFLLLAENNLAKHMMADTIAQPVARHFTRMWLGQAGDYKYRFEEIEDFFNSPSTIQIFGLSPVYGVITGRKIRVKGSVIKPDSSEEELVDFEINSSAELGGIHSEEELTTFIRINPENLRDRLVRWKDDVVRIRTIEKTLIVTGKNLNTPESRVQRYEITGDMESVVFLTPFYRGDYYKSLMKFKGAVAYYVPERFKNYLMRKASYRGVTVPEVDSLWFSKPNRSLVPVLKELDEKFTLTHILGNSITASKGIVNNNILVSLEDLK